MVLDTFAMGDAGDRADAPMPFLCDGDFSDDDLQLLPKPLSPPPAKRRMKRMTRAQIELDREAAQVEEVAAAAFLYSKNAELLHSNAGARMQLSERSARMSLLISLYSPRLWLQLEIFWQRSELA